MINKLNINGLLAAPFTPMYNDGTINLSEIKKYAKFLNKHNLRGAFICGTTGEGILLTEDERMQLAEEWIKYANDDFKIIVHVGTPSANASSVLAAHAQSIGADAIATMGPGFLSPSDVESLVDYCEVIAKAAPKTPFYYYHMPQISHTDISMKEFLINGSKRIPTLCGIKFTNNNLMEMQQCMALDNGRYEILHGYDEVLLAGLALGAVGAVGSTYNYMSNCYNSVIDNFNRGNLVKAREAQQYSVKVVEVLIKYGGGVRAGKEIMGLIGIDCGPARTPIRKFTSAEKNQLKKDLEEIEFFNRIEVI